MFGVLIQVFLVNGLARERIGAWMDCSNRPIWLSEFPHKSFYDSLHAHLRYGVTPSDLPDFVVAVDAHGGQCKTGGLVILRHGKVKGELAHLCALALSNSAVHDESLINPCLAAEDTKPCVEKTNNNHNEEDCGDLLIPAFWDRHMCQVTPV